MSFDLSEYVDVKSRLRLALAKYPDLTITELAPRIIELPDGKTFVEAAVIVGRNADDPKPVQAYCWEPYPGKTPYTRDSEQQNASTSALGRALGYMGFGIETSLASYQEVRNRQADQHPSAEPRDEAPVLQMRPKQEPRQTGTAAGISPGQIKLINDMRRERGLHDPIDLDGMSFADAKECIETLKKIPRVK